MSAAGSTRILAARLRNQHLTRPASLSPAALIAWFGAVQAQEFGPARWGVGQRIRGFDDAAVARAFDAGDIVRTHIMRPTWHFVAPEDLRWMQALTAERVRASGGSVRRAHGLDARLLSRAHRVIGRTLEGGRFLTRQELREALARAGIDAAGQKLAYIVMDAELEALICSGPMRGKQFTYALADERLPRSASKDRDEALAELARRFFQSHGPATLRDFVWWSGLRMGDARRAVDVAHLERLPHAGIDYWHTADALSARPVPSAHLLPIYDEYVNAYRDRGLLFERTPPSADSLFLHYVIVDGHYAGTWKPGASPGTIELRALRRLSRVEQAAIEAARVRHTAFHHG